MSTTTANQPHPGRSTVLVVDDEQPLADLYTDWLDGTYTTRTAYDGQQALAMLDDTVDVVLLDRQMPERSGATVLDAIHEYDYDCRVVMVTAVTPDFDILDMEFEGYLEKPVTKDELADAVGRMLTRERYNDQLQRFYALTSKVIALEAVKSQQELEASEEYSALQVELATVSATLDDALATFKNKDSAAILMELPSDPCLDT